MNNKFLDQTLGTITCNVPGATRVFDAHRIDFCCNGQKTLRATMSQMDIPDPSAILADLAALEQAGPATRTDWRQASSDELIDHIIEQFHDKHREDLPELIRLARRIEEVHELHDACPHGLADELSRLLQELETHMMKEERVLFPMLRRVDASQVPAPISMMRLEHDQHGRELERVAQMTRDMREPDDACNTWRALYAGLRQFRRDLMQHIHLENNILFVSTQDTATA